jgi:large subunit ribosomal protein L15e
MGLYKYIREAWRNPSEEGSAAARQRLLQWRKEPATIRIERPTRLDRARAVGYKAKPGIIIARQRVDRGGRQRPDIKGGRRSKHARQRKILDKSYQQVAEERTARRFPNMEVINSYFVAQDGHNAWYEVILADRVHPAVIQSPLGWVLEQQHRGRVFRGLTSAGRKTRGLRHRGKGAEKLRPSRTANWKKRQK